MHALAADTSSSERNTVSRRCPTGSRLRSLGSLVPRVHGAEQKHSRDGTVQRPFRQDRKQGYANGRGDLLFRQYSDVGISYSLYRVFPYDMQKVFEGGSSL